MATKNGRLTSAIFLSIIQCGAISILPAVACASTSLARAPIAVTQHFSDGSEATLFCPLGTRTAAVKPCRFQLIAGTHHWSADFEPLQFGYAVVYQDFWVYGNIESNDVELSLSVQCSDEDVELLGPEGANADAECKLMFKVAGQELHAMRTQITWQHAGRFIIRQREL